MKAYVGTSGWQYKHWNKKFFPSDLPKAEWLNYLSQKFKSVEVNTTFYHLPRKATLPNWRKQTKPKFLFTLKLYRLFTHVRRLNLKKEDLDSLKYFFAGAKSLKEKLGAILIQLPPSFQADHERLKSFIEQVRKIEKKQKTKFRLSVEFRHESWFTDKTYDYLEKEKIAFVITNSPAWPSKVIKTADFVYMRFHGRTKLFASNYTQKELKDWAKKLKQLKAKEVFAYFNNDANAFAAHNALDLQKYLES